MTGKKISCEGGVRHWVSETAGEAKAEPFERYEDKDERLFWCCNEALISGWGAF